MEHEDYSPDVDRPIESEDTLHSEVALDNAEEGFDPALNDTMNDEAIEVMESNNTDELQEHFFDTVDQGANGGFEEARIEHSYDSVESFEVSGEGVFRDEPPDALDQDALSHMDYAEDIYEKAVSTNEYLSDPIEADVDKDAEPERNEQDDVFFENTEALIEDREDFHDVAFADTTEEAASEDATFSVSDDSFENEWEIIQAAEEAPVYVADSEMIVIEPKGTGETVEAENSDLPSYEEAGEKPIFTEADDLNSLDKEVQLDNADIADDGFSLQDAFSLNPAAEAADLPEATEQAVELVQAPDSEVTVEQEFAGSDNIQYDSVDSILDDFMGASAIEDVSLPDVQIFDTGQELLQEDAFENNMPEFAQEEIHVTDMTADVQIDMAMDTFAETTDPAALSETSMDAILDTAMEVPADVLIEETPTEANPVDDPIEDKDTETAGISDILNEAFGSGTIADSESATMDMLNDTDTLMDNLNQDMSISDVLNDYLDNAAADLPSAIEIAELGDTSVQDMAMDLAALTDFSVPDDDVAMDNADVGYYDDVSDFASID